MGSARIPRGVRLLQEPRDWLRGTIGAAASSAYMPGKRKPDWERPNTPLCGLTERLRGGVPKSRNGALKRVAARPCNTTWPERRVEGAPTFHRISLW
jgi:hypothetical protein